MLDDKKGMQVEIVADSINPSGNRITSFLMKYQRFIHSELMTHRTLSRNAASSRAIPVSKIIQSIKDDPAMPTFWGKQQSGMQAAEELTGSQLESCKRGWLLSRDLMIDNAEALVYNKLHKQIANRILEPWFHIVVLVTATEWGNFFNLRVHKDAQPEFQALAAEALRKYTAATPKRLEVDEWHLPFNDKDIDPSVDNDTRLKIVTARAARTSYKNFDGTIDIAKDCELHDALAKSGHWSPFEHAAAAGYADTRSGNFRGWVQYRKTFFSENQEHFNAAELLGKLK